MDRKWLEFSVGIFMLVGLACLGYVSFSLGNLRIGSSGYEVKAVFSTVSGLKAKAPISMAGVHIGEVSDISLQDGQARVTLLINNGVKLEDDVVASIKTSGIIGDKYLSISPGASDTYIRPGGVIHETRPPLDIEALISKFVFGSVEGKDTKKNKDGLDSQDGGAKP